MCVYGVSSISPGNGLLSLRGSNSQMPEATFQSPLRVSKKSCSLNLFCKWEHTIITITSELFNVSKFIQSIHFVQLNHQLFFTGFLNLDTSKLKRQIRDIQKPNRHILRDAVSSLSLNELKNLESGVQKGLSRVRSIKVLYYQHSGS
ncbi:Agamous-like MADS-box protein AGL5 [Glycine soja]